MTMTRKLAVAVVAALAACAQAQAQTYPTKPIRFVTGAAGGGNDFVTRAVAQGVAAALGQPTVVDNKASGVIEGDTVAKSAADGYTWMMLTSQLLVASNVFKDHKINLAPPERLGECR